MIRGSYNLCKWLLTLLLLCGLPLLTFGQNTSTLTGTVVDDQNEPLMGATVVVVGQQNLGAITDIDGHFSIPGVPTGSTIRVSYVGMNTVEVKLQAGQKTLNVTLRADTELLEEVVVTGYGGQQVRTKVTNSIAKVDEKALKVGVYSNPSQALAGAVPGLKVYTTSGNPGAQSEIVLRGGTRMDGSGSPLVLVDGQLRGSLSDINPEDIASIDILKDAGATALYGARASNGVILITTKSGKYGTSSVNFKAKVGMNFLNNPYEFLNGEDYIRVLREAYARTPWAPKNNLTSASPFGTGNTLGPGMIWSIMGQTPENEYLLGQGWKSMVDPLDESKKIIYKEADIIGTNIISPSITQDYNVNISGGNEKGTYYAGLGYNDSQGLPYSSWYKRYNFLFNGSYKISDFIEANSSLNFTRANWESMPGTQSNEGNYFGRLLSLPPTVRYEDEEGNPVLGPSYSDGNQSYQPGQFVRDNQTDKFTMIQGLKFNFTPDLSLKLTGNWYYDLAYSEAFNKDFETSIGKFNRGRSSSASTGKGFAQTYNAVLNYNHLFAGAHNLSVLVGGEYYDRYDRGFSASGEGAPTDDFMDLGYTDNGEGKRGIDSNHSRYRILSFFGRVNYDYKDKYLLSLVSRYDGYSSLLGRNRWGFFPGVSGGWIFTNEDFMKDYSWLSFGKLRASYGINGNASSIGAYTLQGDYRGAKYAGLNGFLIGNLPNPGLRWERTRTFEVGVDLGFLNNKINTALTYYNRLTSDLHSDFSLPSTTGFSSVKNNNGKYLNQGIEFEVKANIYNTKDFRWDIAANIAYNKNLVVQLPDNGQPNNRQGGTEVYTGRKKEDGTYEKVFIGGYQEGQEPGMHVGYVVDHILQEGEVLPETYIVADGNIGNVQGKVQYSQAAWDKLTDAERKNGILIRPGNIIWKDINGDGKIDQFDRVNLGNTSPRWNGGFNTTLSYKGLSFYARFDFALDYKIYDGTKGWFMGVMQGTYNTLKESVTDTWTPSNPGAKYPIVMYADQLGTGDYYRKSSLMMYNGDYLGIRELSLSYTLPQEWLKNVWMKNLTFSVTGQNLGYITAADVATPETPTAGSGYALPRTLLFGLDIQF